MQTLLNTNKLRLALFFFICANAHAQVSSGAVTYDLVDRKGVPFHNFEAAHQSGMFFRQKRLDGSFTDSRMPEFDSMAKDHNFEFYLLDDSLISAAQGDYF